MIMLVLPFLFVGFVFRFPAGLLLYWITTNIWTFGQQQFLRRVIGKGTSGATLPELPEGAVAASGSGGGGLMARLSAAAGGAGGGATEPATATKEKGGTRVTKAPPPPPKARKRKRSGRRR
jgi:YidC/Oxa1 family membrane protein insertase